jgi:hypothetical protein
VYGSADWQNPTRPSQRSAGWDAHIGRLPINNFTIAPDKGYFVKCSQSSTFVPD